MSDHTQKPFYLSMRWTAYVLTLVALVALAAVKASADAVQYLSLAVMLALPVLIGGESARRVLGDAVMNKTKVAIEKITIPGAGALLLALALSSCAGIIGNLVPGGTPTVWLSGVGVRYAPQATQPWPGIEALAAATAEVLEGEHAKGWAGTLWLDVLGASDSFNGRSGIGHTPFATPPDLKGTITLENHQPIAIGKQAQHPGDPIPNACESVLPWEISRVVRSVETGHQLYLEHTDPESNRIMVTITNRCRELFARPK